MNHALQARMHYRTHPCAVLCEEAVDERCALHKPRVFAQVPSPFTLAEEIIAATGRCKAGSPLSDDRWPREPSERQPPGLSAPLPISGNNCDLLRLFFARHYVHLALKLVDLSARNCRDAHWSSALEPYIPPHETIS